MSRILVTGAPGTGKTTLLLALQARGYTIVGDSARTIIQDRRRRGLAPRPDPYAFAHEALRMDIEKFIAHVATPGPVFFERGVLDALCLLDRGTWTLKSRVVSRLPTRLKRGAWLRLRAVEIVALVMLLITFASNPQ